MTSTSPDLLAAYRRQVPTDPLEHRHGEVGVSSRWWYLLRMYSISGWCGRCTKVLAKTRKAGDFLKNQMKRSQQRYVAGTHFATVGRTNQLYVVPCVRSRIRPPCEDQWATEAKTWPRYRNGEYSDDPTRCDGESMLALSRDEYQALAVVILRCDVKEQTYGAQHQKNWKKVGLSRAYFRKELVTEESMPTPKAAAAFRYLTKPDKETQVNTPKGTQKITHRYGNKHYKLFLACN